MEKNMMKISFSNKEIMKEIPLNFSDFKQMLCTEFKIDSLSLLTLYNITYLDEENECITIDSEEDLCPLAQKNEYCKRYYNYVEPVEQKGEYQSDFERIISSKAFRRMVDKAQVFSASKGDYYRTRMTHTQLVAQVAY